jgi:hypothetical protein
MTVVYNEARFKLALAASNIPSILAKIRKEVTVI